MLIVLIFVKMMVMGVDIYVSVLVNIKRFVVVLRNG